MKGAAMKLGQVMSFLDVGLVPEEHREEFQRKLGELRDAAPKVRFADMRKVIESELERAARARSSPRSTRSRSPPPRSARSTARALHDGRDVAVKVQYPGVAAGGAGRHAEPRDDPAADEADRARARRQGDRRGDPLAHRRRARLRARGAEPALAGAHLPRPPVHRRARRRHARSRARRCWSREFVRGRRLRRDQGDATRRRATASARSSSASSSAACTATTSSPATRTRATSCCMADGRVAFLDFGLFKVMPQRADRARARVPARRPRGRRASGCSEIWAETGFLAQPDRFRPGQAARPVPRRDLVVRARRGDRSSSRRSRPR